MSLPELLERAAARPAGSVDVDRMWRTGRNRRRRTQAAAVGVLAAAAVAAALVLPGLTPGDGVVLLPAPPPADAVPVSPPPAPPTPTPMPTRTPADWQDLTLAEALDGLIAVNETAPAVPIDGVRVTRTVVAWLSGLDESEEKMLELVVIDTRRLPDRSGTMSISPIPGLLALDTSAERLREIVGATNLDGLTVREVHTYDPGEMYPEDQETLLAGAETLATAPDEPRESETELPARVRAAFDAAYGLSATVPSPPQRIRALRIFGGLGPEAVEYGGVERDLLGREASRSTC